MTETVRRVQRQAALDADRSRLPRDIRELVPVVGVLTAVDPEHFVRDCQFELRGPVEHHDRYPVSHGSNLLHAVNTATRLRAQLSAEWFPEVVGMYSTLMLSDLIEARYAARLAEAERRRQIRQLAQQRVRRLRGSWHLLPVPHRHPATPLTAR